MSKAVQNVNGKLARELVGSSSKDQKDIDKKMIALDGTEINQTLAQTLF